MAEAGRVIAGSARGLRLRAPGEGTRPIGDRVKQTLFAVLEAGTLGPWPAAFLDLFAGSGACGIEALSRGAPRAVFVERERSAIAAIRANVHAAGFDDRSTVVAGDVLGYLAGSPVRETFGAVVVDPPYGDATLVGALERLAEPGAGWLSGEAVVVAKHFWRDLPPARVGRLERVRERRFGETALSFYVAVPSA